jgi:hypothetical protein
LPIDEAASKAEAANIVAILTFHSVALLSCSRTDAIRVDRNALAGSSPVGDKTTGWSASEKPAASDAT